MSEPKRIRDFEDHPALRAALDAGADDRAPDGAEARMLAALGLVTVAKAATVATAASAGAKAGATKLALFAGATKWVVASTVVAVVATGGAVAYRAAEPPPRVAPEAPTVHASKPPVPHEVTPPPRPTSSAPVAAEPEPEPAPQPTAIAPPVRPARTPVIEPVPVPSAPSTLSDELAMLADANAAVRRRDADAANRALDRYDARFPRGALATEAESLRIESVALRDPARGRALAASFLQRNPKSPVAPRMRKIAEAP